MEHINNNTLHQGDAFSIMKNMPDNSVDLVVTDPPYFMAPVSAVKYNGKVSNLQDKLNARFFYEELFSQIYRVLNDKGKAFVFMNLVSFQAAQAALDTLGIEMRNLIIWDKDFPGLGGNNRKLRYSYELILYFGKPDGLILNRKTRDIIRIAGNPQRRKTKHPAEKPLELMERLIEISEIQSGTVLDPFIGSGTTIIAAQNKGFNAIGIEAHPEFYNMARSRISASIADDTATYH